MYIKSLKLMNFRNYNNFNIDFSKNINVIYGDNAQGKTSILEAIFLCASGRSHKTSKDAELIKINSFSGYLINLELIKNFYESKIEICYNKDNSKRITINDIKLKKIGNLMGNLIAVMFSPEDLLIIKEGPSERRRFVDITISQIKPSYFYDLQQYNKALLHRNNLLKNLQQNTQLSDTLDVWNKNVASIGARIIQARNGFINELNKNAMINHYKLTGNKEKLVIKYVSSFSIGDFNNLQNIENSFIKSLETSINKDIFRGSTAIGPHRDDFELFLNDKNLKLFGSQGQQRTAILSIKLSEIAIMKEYSGETPVVLLDDVMSELDNKRQQYLIESLQDLQIFITCTDKNFFENKFNNNVNFIGIDNGALLF